MVFWVATGCEERSIEVTRGVWFIDAETVREREGRTRRKKVVCGPQTVWRECGGREWVVEQGHVYCVD